MIWGNSYWIKEFPHFNIAYDYDFKHGKSGILKMEFWVTPFNHSSTEGYHRELTLALWRWLLFR